VDILFHWVTSKKGRIAIQPEAEHHTLLNSVQAIIARFLRAAHITGCRLINQGFYRVQPFTLHWYPRNCIGKIFD
jgi:hypothetical protein